MARKEVSFNKSTTIVANSKLMDRVAEHTKQNDSDNQSKFITRALVNQLEREGDFEIRDIVESEQEETI